MLKPIFVWAKQKLVAIDPFDVVVLETHGNYTKVTLANGIRHLVRSTLYGAVKKFPPGMFVKVDRACVISIYHITSLDKEELKAGPHVTSYIKKGYYKSIVEELNVIGLREE